MGRGRKPALSEPKDSQMTHDTRDHFTEYFCGAFLFTLAAVAFAHYASATNDRARTMLDCETEAFEAFDRDLTVAEIEAVEDACSGGR